MPNRLTYAENVREFIIYNSRYYLNLLGKKVKLKIITFYSEHVFPISIKNNKHKKAFSNSWGIYYFLVTTHYLLLQNCSLWGDGKKEGQALNCLNLSQLVLYWHAEWEVGRRLRRRQLNPSEELKGESSWRVEPILVLPAKSTGLVNHSIFLFFLFPEQNWKWGWEKREESQTLHLQPLFCLGI